MKTPPTEFKFTNDPKLEAAMHEKAQRDGDTIDEALTKAIINRRDGLLASRAKKASKATITFAVPADLMRRTRRAAASQGKTVNKFISDALADLVK